MSDGKPNIVLVVMDTARAQNFSCYGYERETTPFLDGLAEENVKYENAYSQARWTLPSHASMFSGKYISEHRAFEDMSFSDIDYFQEKLSEKGYTNLGVANISFLSAEYDADEMFDDLVHMSPKSIFSGISIDRSDFKDRRNKKKYFELAWKIISEGSLENLKLLSDRFIGVLKDYLLISDSGAEKTNRVAKEKLKNLDDEPFFLFLNYTEPHIDYKPPLPYSHKFLTGIFRWKSILDRSNEDMKYYLDSDREPPHDHLEDWKALYDGELNYLDSKLNDLYEYIKQDYPNTVFIFTSDHGEYFYEHNRIAHWSGIHEQTTKVPLIEVFPDSISEDVSGIVETRGLKDHILNLSEGGSELMESVEYAVAEDYGRPVDQSLDHGISKQDAERLAKSSVKIRKSDKEMIWYEDGEKELYALPEENKITDESVKKKLTDILRKEVGDPKDKDDLNTDFETNNQQIKESLEELGYL